MFSKELQFHMVEQQVHSPGSEIIKIGENCNSILFIVNGLVDIKFIDASQNLINVDTLKQGDSMGQYSVINGNEFEFVAIARTNVRVLSISSELLHHYSDEYSCGYNR